MWTIRAVFLIVTLYPNDISPSLGFEASAVSVKTEGDVNLKGSFIFIIYSEPCCPGSITLDASAAIVKKWPQYFGGYNPTGKRYHGSPVYINQHGLFLFVNSKGVWSANNKINEWGVLRGTGTGSSRGGNCVASVTIWKLWIKHEWRSANITASCIEGT